MKHAKFLLLSLVIPLVSLQGCKDHDDADPAPNEEELITTLKLSFVKWDESGVPAGDAIEYFWRDPEASGSPEIDEIILDAHATYTLNIEVLDESKSPAEDITEEIILEADKHQFFFSIDGAQATIEYHDSDANADPLGLENVVHTDHESAGSLSVILRHEPDKKAQGVSDGDVTNAGGDTDIEAEFPFTIVE